MFQKYFYFTFMMIMLTASVAFAEQNPSVNACQKDSDCILVVYDCNQAAVFNKTHLLDEKKKLCKTEDCSLRDCGSLRHVDHLPQCLMGQCSVKSTPKDDLDPGGKKWIKRFVYTNRPNFAKNKDEKKPVSLGIASKPAK